MEPLVTCIMPTYNRPGFIPQAVRCFLSQDYPEKELLVVDDGSQPVGDLLPAGDRRIRYVRLKQRLTTGAKRNLACEQARGSLIMHWDDDDWHAPQRIRTQVNALLQSGSEVCGLRQMLFYDLENTQAWLYTYPASQRPWLAGGSLLYQRRFWEHNRFPDLQVGEDTRFIWNHTPTEMLALPDYSFYVAFIHPGNTSPKKRGGLYWSRWDGDIPSLVGVDLENYTKAALQPAPINPATEAATGVKPPEENLPAPKPVSHLPVTIPLSPIKLNLGCCDAHLPGFINVDLVPSRAVDQVADLSCPWPWRESSIAFARLWDVIEHLPDKIHTMNELWRVLLPGGRAEIQVPTTDGSGAFQDPTHVSYWNRRSFLYYEDRNPYRERFACYYGITARFKIVQERTDRSLDGPRLMIVLEAVKP